MADLYGWDIFTAGESALDLLGNAIRAALSGDVFEGKTRFMARALEDAYVLTATQARGINNSSTTGGTGESYAFRARIIGENSPHEFIPDPCDPAYATDKQYVNQLISMHTLFINSNQVSSQDVTRGDMVAVELEMGWFSYELEYGTFVDLVSVEEPPSTAGAHCASLRNLHWQGAETVARASSGTDPTMTRSHGGSTALQKMAPYVPGAAPTPPCPDSKKGYCENNNCANKANPNMPPDHFTEVAPGEGNYRGATITSKEQMKLIQDKFGIKTIVSLAIDASWGKGCSKSGGHFPVEDASTSPPCKGQKVKGRSSYSDLPCEKYWADELGIKWYQVVMHRSRAPSKAEWPKIWNDLSSGNVYFHCTHGVDRTGAVTARWKWCNAWGPGNDKWPDKDWSKLKAALWKYTKKQGGAWKTVDPGDPKSIERKDTGANQYKLYDWMFAKC